MTNERFKTGCLSIIIFILVMGFAIWALLPYVIYIFQGGHP